MYIFLQIAPKRAQRGNYLKSHSLLIKTNQTQSTRSFLPHTQYMKNECWQLCMTRCMTSFVFFIAIFVKIRLNTRFPNFLTILEEKSASSAENVSIYTSFSYGLLRKRVRAAQKMFQYIHNFLMDCVRKRARAARKMFQFFK